MSRFAPLFGGLLLSTLVGCAGRGDLSGKVSYQGKSLRYGTVLVLGSDGVPKASVIQEDGTYNVQGIPAGSVKIAFNSPDPAETQPAQRKPGTAPPKADRTGWFAIPKKYGDFEKSGLTFNLGRGQNSHDIDLR